MGHVGTDLEWEDSLSQLKDVKKKHNDLQGQHLGF